ncbi:peptidoglycan hydrolase [Chania multitudinisentens RB-25]|uniref:Peptidoglycan hydrolase n=1 Tax=Chania multitudinisentens RB-25 TaxID=1441930 RepID=W0LBN3_9GAMM|nr:rod-binding protein [Chania multitudinisentens]AHG19677.1 peptidoglycan hydrolase [Chania multitudinisentens RB-25]
MMNPITPQSPVLPGDFTGQVKPQDLEQAAEQFETLFLRSILTQMRKAADVMGEDSPFNSKQQRIMRDFYDDSLAVKLASQRSTGIAQMIVNQLSPPAPKEVKEARGVAALTERVQELKTPVIPVMSRRQE